MMKRLKTGVAALALMASMATAQEDVVFIQVEARTSLNSAQQSVNQFSGRVADVNGFSLGGGWYGVALGPYSREQAQRMLVELRRQGLIPRDSYIEQPGAYTRQFWPVGSQVLAELTVVPAPAAPAQSATTPVVVAEPAPTTAPIPDETPRQARASERDLTRAQREDLQMALKWAGVYTAAIDGAFGRGTRRAMGEWQSQNGYEPTGILTTRQRADLLGQFNAILDGLDMAVVSDSRAGISMQMPTGITRFDRYEAPFALYQASGTPEVQLLLISQPGDRKTMNGLYEIMQTLEIVPLEGTRKRAADGFTLTGENDRIISHTEVSLKNDEIKGFTLIWPAGDEERRGRVLGLMQNSFTRTDGILDPAAVTDSGQTVDLVSGLKVRKPRANASGFFVDGSGTVLTSAALVQGCTRVTLDGTIEAEVVASDNKLDVAALRPAQSIAPRGIAAFRGDEPRLQSEVAVAGYSFGGRLNAPSLTFGTLEDLQGLNGEDGVTRLALAALPGDTGGPVFDSGGLVVGMMMDRETGGTRRLPEDVRFATSPEQLLDFMQGNGLRAQTQSGQSIMAPEDLTALAADTTVLVSCWD